MMDKEQLFIICLCLSKAFYNALGRIDDEASIQWLATKTYERELQRRQH
jgi:hypothetical protein